MGDDGLFIGEHQYCLAKEFPVKSDGTQRRACGSSDALAIYEHTTGEGVTWYDGTCFSCKQKFDREEVHSSSLSGFLGVGEGTLEVVEKKEFENKATKKKKITREEVQELWVRTGGKEGNSGNGYRGLSDWVLRFYGHRIEHDNLGKVKAVYYPETSAEDGKLNGYKSRHLPKKFGIGNVGKTGVINQLSGQHKFPNGGRYALVCAGEEDKCAAQDMLREYQKMKGQADYDPYAVVSPTTGEPSAAKQCRQQYDWFDKFDIIIIGMDVDEVGEEAAQEIAKVLPRDKVRIAKWSGKDPNQMLLDGKKKQFWSDFFGAKEVIDSGVYNANDDMVQDVIDVLTTPRIPLPPFASQLEKMTKGSGLFTRSIYSLIGDTSVGKSTHIDAWIFHWMFNVPDHKVGIVSVEATKGEWVAGMLSTYLENNLWWIPIDEIEDYMNTPEVKAKINNFFYNEYGESRFAIVDDREGTVESLQKCIDKLERQYGCTIIVNDVLTDILRVVDNEAQARHFNWQSNFVKNGATIFNILHTRKSGDNRGGKPTFPNEFDAYGNSIFVQKAAGNFVIARNKEAPNDDIIEQNTTYLRVPKLRKGVTGSGGAWYYDGDTRKVYDRDTYFKDNPEKLPVGYDLTISSFDRAYWEEGGRGWDGVSSGNNGFKMSKPKEKPVEPDWEIDVGGDVKF
ncbi:primase/helicase protein [Pseudoalteromonas phage J2-1]|uniref:Primase/helicase protein n=1 Tax=Pseudoalteromonas phage J2-1 TaxID=2023998 RepID=A0A223LGK2_9CAUD|nr:primase/helicase protein [Pseudoalteromonas phage J2-1]ASU03354.1 primase/helicase protein [Pseudoalteromonas phage J2-1]